MAPADMMDRGRLAVLVDPSGAVVGLWQPGAHPGAAVFNASGTLSWNELQTRDLDSALPFHEQLFGWRFEPGDHSGYLTIALDAKPGEGKMNGGAMSMPLGVPDEAPNFWAAYFAVEDCDAALARRNRRKCSLCQLGSMVQSATPESVPWPRPTAHPVL